MASPDVASDPDRLRDLGRAFAELDDIVRPYRAYLERAPRRPTRPARSRPARPTPRWRPSSPRRPPRRDDRAARLRPSSSRCSSRRIPNEGKDLILEIRAGAGGQEAALWAGDLFEMYRRLAERHRWKTDVLASSPSDLGGFKEVSLEVRGADAFGAAEARGRRPPGPAGAGHRVPGADPHLDRDGRRDAGGRGGRGRDPARGPADRRLPLERPGRAVGQHHRLRRPDRPQADGDQGRDAGGALAAAEPREGDAVPARAAVPDGARRGAGQAGRRPAARSSARGSAPRRSGPTTSPRAGSPTTGSSTRRTSCRTCWPAARRSTGSSTSCSRPSGPRSSPTEG